MQECRTAPSDLKSGIHPAIASLRSAEGCLKSFSPTKETSVRCSPYKGQKHQPGTGLSWMPECSTVPEDPALLPTPATSIRTKILSGTLLLTAPTSQKKVHGAYGFPCTMTEI